MRQRTATDKTAATRSLHLCPHCESELVQPIRWEQASDRTHWRVWRRCPECEWTANSVHGEVEIDAFDEELDLGTRALSEELKALEQDNMRHMAETLAVALEADLISADDFR